MPALTLRTPPVAHTVHYVLITVTISTIMTLNYTILVNNQLDALLSMYLFHFSTRFEQPSAHHQENQLYQYIIAQTDR
jgi:hypothetical protein